MSRKINIMYGARDLLDTELKNVGVIAFNDKRTHKEVLAVFDRVIKAAKKRADSRRKK